MTTLPPDLTVTAVRAASPLFWTPRSFTSAHDLLVLNQIRT
jgi:hypothetical protein